MNIRISQIILCYMALWAALTVDAADKPLLSSPLVSPSYTTNKFEVCAGCTSVAPSEETGYGARSQMVASCSISILQQEQVLQGQLDQQSDKKQPTVPADPTPKSTMKPLIARLHTPLWEQDILPPYRSPGDGELDSDGDSSTGATIGSDEPSPSPPRHSTKYNGSFTWENGFGSSLWEQDLLSSDDQDDDLLWQNSLRPLFQYTRPEAESLPILPGNKAELAFHSQQVLIHNIRGQLAFDHVPHTEPILGRAGPGELVASHIGTIKPLTLATECPVTTVGSPVKEDRGDQEPLALDKPEHPTSDVEDLGNRPETDTDDELSTCICCFETLTDEEISVNALLPCHNHRVCLECFKAHVSNCVKSFQTTSCPAVDCKQVWGGNLIASVTMDQALGEKAESRLFQIAMGGDRTCFTCPAPDCGYVGGSPLADEIDENQRLETECPKCHNPLIFTKEAGLEVLQLVTADQLSEQLIGLELDNANYKRCPNCRLVIEKRSGCQHMTCTKCKHNFCWVCLEPWFEDSIWDHWDCASRRRRGAQAPANRRTLGYRTFARTHQQRPAPWPDFSGPFWPSIRERPARRSARYSQRNLSAQVPGDTRTIGESEDLNGVMAALRNVLSQQQGRADARW